MALGIRYNASATLALICCLLHTGLAQHESRLNSVFLEHRLKASKFYVISETVEQFNEARGLQHSNLSWKHDCKPECYQNKGTCNLLTGVCQCPIGRVHSDAGVHQDEVDPRGNSLLRAYLQVTHCVQGETAPLMKLLTVSWTGLTCLCC